MYFGKRLQEEQWSHVKYEKVASVDRVEQIEQLRGCLCDSTRLLSIRSMPSVPGRSKFLPVGVVADQQGSTVPKSLSATIDSVGPACSHLVGFSIFLITASLISYDGEYADLIFDEAGTPESRDSVCLAVSRKPTT